MTHELPELPYTLDALEPYMSTETLQYHYGKHFAGYVDKLNTLIAHTPFIDTPLEQIILKAKGPVFNNAAQAFNHKFFFEALSPNPQLTPKGAMLLAMEKKWGTCENFRKDFDAAAMDLFGSGWVWLVVDKSGELSIVSKPNAENPICDGLTPILVLDVWEHAYYIDYRNRRAEFIAAFWKVVDWAMVDKRFISTLQPEK